ncbi:MAG: hypothetical protein ACLSA6_16280 [Holdemania massiliensis]
MLKSIEEGMLEDTPYQWTILSDEDRFISTCRTSEGLKEEHHVQTVDPLAVPADGSGRSEVKS